jgi:hypothetical protein
MIRRSRRHALALLVACAVLVPAAALAAPKGGGGGGNGGGKGKPTTTTSSTTSSTTTSTTSSTTTTTTAPRMADLAVTITDNPDPWIAVTDPDRNGVKYSVRIENHGAGTAKANWVEGSLDGDNTDVRVTTTSGSCGVIFQWSLAGNLWILTCDLGDIAVGDDPVDITLTAVPCMNFAVGGGGAGDVQSFAGISGVYTNSESWDTFGDNYASETTTVAKQELCPTDQ